MDEAVKQSVGEMFMSLSLNHPWIYYSFALVFAFSLAAFSGIWYAENSSRDPEIAKMSDEEKNRSKLYIFLLILVLTLGTAYFIRSINN